MKSSSELISNLSRTGHSQHYSGRDDLIRQIEVIGEKKPSKAKELHRRVLFCAWTRFDLFKLSQEGLNVSRVQFHKGLLGGNQVDLILKLSDAVIKIAVRGNKRTLEKQQDKCAVPAEILFKDSLPIQGTMREDVFSTHQMV